MFVQKGVKMFGSNEGRIKEFASGGFKFEVGDLFDHNEKLCGIRAVKNSTENRARIAGGEIPIVTHNHNAFWTQLNSLTGEFKNA